MCLTKMCLFVTFYGLTTVLLDAATSGTVPSCDNTHWDSIWYNDSHPTNSWEDHEPLPNTTILHDACDSQKGTLVLRCSADQDRYEWIQGIYDNGAYNVECSTAVNGSYCAALGSDLAHTSEDLADAEYTIRSIYDCPDYAIQLGCDFCRVPTPPPPGTTTGSVSQPPPDSTCNCLKGTNQQPNVTSMLSVECGLIVFSLCILLLLL